MTAQNLVYFHGQPGSPDELRLVSQHRDIASIFAPDRGADRTDLSFEQYLDALAGDILARFPSGSLRLIGFSMGAFVAMEISIRLTAQALGRDIKLDLISPPAPLDTGNYLPHMAGGVVFNLAKSAPWAFRIMTGLQAKLAAAAPQRLYRQLFSTAAGDDKALAETADFEAVILALLDKTLRGEAKGYRREVLAFVRSSADRLNKVTAPVTLWQGTADNWTPPAMADALSHALPNLQDHRRFQGLSHYSTLIAALTQILVIRPKTSSGT